MSGPENLPWGDVPVRAGDVLAEKYRIDKVLGVGGMGAVVAATHLQLDQKVALKFMLPQGMASQALVERFAREARAAVRLKSDHVARVLDVGTLPWGAPFMVMEYLAGDDLGSIIGSQGPMTVAGAVDCVLQACDAVAEAHALGIVHRDLKPRNLFLTQRNDGRALVKVLDFGISKHKTGSDLSLTGTTEVIGSPYYMSPEQLKSARAADERSDIWALGVILYELLTGQVPFQAESVTALTAMVLQENPARVEQLRADVPREVGSIVARCLQKDPGLRFPNVAELAAALQPFAPADSQELANRIARIGGSKPPPNLSASSGARVAVSGSTSVNWAEHTQAAPGGARAGGKVALGIGLAMLGLGGATLAGVLLMRPRVDPAATTAPATVSVAAAVPGTPVVGSPSEPAAAPSASAVASSVPSGAPSSSAAAQGQGAGRPAVPRGGAGPAGSTGAAPAAGSSGEPPRYRTSW